MLTEVMAKERKAKGGRKRTYMAVTRLPEAVAQFASRHMICAGAQPEWTTGRRNQGNMDTRTELEVVKENSTAAR